MTSSRPLLLLFSLALHFSLTEAVVLDVWLRFGLSSLYRLHKENEHGYVKHQTPVIKQITCETRFLSCAAVVRNPRKLLSAASKSVYFFTLGFTQPLSCAIWRSCMKRSSSRKMVPQSLM